MAVDHDVLAVVHGLPVALVLQVQLDHGLRQPTTAEFAPAVCRVTEDHHSRCPKPLQPLLQLATGVSCDTLESLAPIGFVEHVAATIVQ